MKFTCPACHKIHRVTLSITTPGEDAPPAAKANTRSMTRGQPAIPKKYATGAFAPVVDIPIDANFILLDGRPGNQPGIDLGNAAAPGIGRTAGEIPSRQTGGSVPLPAGRGTEPAVDAGLSPIAGRAGSGEKPERAPDGGEEMVLRPRSAGSGGRKRSHPGLVALLAAILAAGGLFGWQQYLQRANRQTLEAELSEAEQAWRLGKIAEAADKARAAAGTLSREKEFLTAANVWNRLAGWSGGALPRLGDGVSVPEAAIAGHLERERRLIALGEGFDPAAPPGSIEEFSRETGEIRARGDLPLAAALERLAAGRILGRLEEEERGNTPEENLRRAEMALAAFPRVFSAPERESLAKSVEAFKSGQRNRLLEEAGMEAASLAAAAAAGDDSALERFRLLKERLSPDPENGEPLPKIEGLAGREARPALDQLSRLVRLVDLAVSRARSSLSRGGEGGPDFSGLLGEAAGERHPHPALAEAAVRKIEAAAAEAEELLELRESLFAQVQANIRRERNYPGVRLAWAMLRIGFADPEVEIDPSGFSHDSRQASMRFRLRGLPVLMEMGENDYETRIRARVAGYDFVAGWSPIFHKPLSWMAGLAGEMRRAGAPSENELWEVIEGPGEPLALSRSGAASAAAAASLAPEPGRLAFFGGRLRRIEELPPPDDARRVGENFLLAARRLHDGVMEDASIPQELRQALKPVLLGAFQRPDPQDYFDSRFCRRLLEADYLETFIRPLPEGRRGELADYREALGRLEAGRDAFSVELDGGERLVAVERLDLDQAGGEGGGDQDPETGERPPRYTWRWEKGDKTVFFSPMPSRFVYAFVLAEHYPGGRTARPAGRPVLTEIWHLEKGRIASYAVGADRAEGDAERWREAIAGDLSGRFDPSMGPPGWNFPLHVIERDDQGDPLTLATLSGTVKSPDFSGFAETGERRRAEDAWLASTALTLSTPGELGLIFQQFFRYCSDSPLPELPNLIGSHFGLSDTHQTVHETLERRWVGRLIGDCDDLAEFFQILTRLQGKLSHVMQLPSHAACGYVEREGPDQYRFIVLQTGPVMQFNAPSLNEVVETAYRSFDRGEGLSHLTPDAVPLLLRFADEETRTPFVLSARIYEDAEYADTMIRVQSYWHENIYSAAIGVMEEMLAGDQEIGNIKELGSLYERVGEYSRSAELRLRELELVRGNPQATISTLLEIAELRRQEKDREKALAALEDMEKVMLDMIRREDAQEFFRAITFRSLWAIHMARLGRPARAWTLVKYDVEMTKRQLGRVADPVLRTLVAIYERMRLELGDSAAANPADAAALREIRRELEGAFGRGYFKGDESYNAVIARFYLLGRYAVADRGRPAGLAALIEDGPWPTEPRDQTRRSRGVTQEDWKWLRITPQLYLALALEMLDRDDFPELYDPVGAGILLENVVRAVKRGTGLGSDISGGDDVTKAAITLAFLNRDLGAFRQSMKVVMEKDYSSLYDDAAMTFGLHCGLIPPSEFPAWIAAFREFFPGTQHYFKVVYRAIDKENYDHALLMAEATAKFFPDRPLLVGEAEFVRRLVPVLKSRRAARDNKGS
jgi:hypothetical protein